MKKVLSFLIMLFIVNSLNAEAENVNNNSLKIEKTSDCIDEARSIAFFMMDEFGFTEDQAADLVLLLIEDC